MNKVDVNFEQNGVPYEYTVSTQTWLAKNNYVALQEVFTRGMAAYGYGDFRQIPIVSLQISFKNLILANSIQLYMLQYFSPDILLALAGVTPLETIGMRSYKHNSRDLVLTSYYQITMQYGLSSLPNISKALLC